MIYVETKYLFHKFNSTKPMCPCAPNPVQVSLQRRKDFIFEIQGLSTRAVTSEAEDIQASAGPIKATQDNTKMSDEDTQVPTPSGGVAGGRPNLYSF